MGAENELLIKNEIKGYIYASGWKMKDLAKKINKSNKYAEQNFNNKLVNGTIKYSEVKKIAEILGYTIEWKKK